MCVGSMKLWLTVQKAWEFSDSGFGNKLYTYLGATEHSNGTSAIQEACYVILLLSLALVMQNAALAH